MRWRHLALLHRHNASDVASPGSEASESGDMSDAGLLPPLPERLLAAGGPPPELLCCRLLPPSPATALAAGLAALPLTNPPPIMRCAISAVMPDRCSEPLSASA